MKQLTFCRPEEVGLSSTAILQLVENLELCTAEPHSLLIYRHGKVCAQGWWKPYAPGLRHGMQSFTKTLISTAIGIAYTKGMLDINEYLVDLFPESLPENPSENLKQLKIRDLLAMAVGSEKVPTFEGDWIQNFFAQDLVHKPGTAFFYNSVGTTMLGAVLRQKTGQTVQGFLTEHFYEKVGICPDNVRWIRLRDGIEIGGSGAFIRTEDMLRIVKVYLDGGMCDGERILSEEYVKMATSIQTVNDDIKQNPNACRRDWRAGYGFQMWMCSREGAYRADGAAGQYAIVLPKEDMIIVLTETAKLGDGAQASLDIIWNYMDHAFDVNGENAEKDALRLENRLSRLALPAVACQPAGDREKFSGTWKITEGRLYIDPPLGGIMDEYFPRTVVSHLTLSFGEHVAFMDYILNGKNQHVEIGLDGNYRINQVPVFGVPADQLALSGAFVGEEFQITARFIETVFCFNLDMRVQGDEMQITKNFQRGQVKDDHLVIQAVRIG